MATSPASRADDAPVEPHALGRLAGLVGERGGGDGGGIVELRRLAVGDLPSAIDAGEPGAVGDALGGDAAVRALQMRPDRPFLLRLRPEADVAELGGDGRVAAGRLDQRGDAEAGAGAENRARALVAEAERADLTGPGVGNGGQRQSLRLEVVEQQAGAEIEPPPDLRARRSPKGRW